MEAYITYVHICLHLVLCDRVKHCGKRRRGIFAREMDFGSNLDGASYTTQLEASNVT